KTPNRKSDSVNGPAEAFGVQHPTPSPAFCRRRHQPSMPSTLSIGPGSQYQRWETEAVQLIFQCSFSGPRFPPTLVRILATVCPQRIQLPRRHVCLSFALVLALVCPLFGRHVCPSFALVLALVCPLSVQLFGRHICPTLAVPFFFSRLL